MTFMTDVQQLRTGLVIFRRTDVKHRKWYCRIKVPKEDRYKTISLKFIVASIAAVRSPADAVRDPRVQARGETVQLDHPQFGRVADVVGMGIPITFSDTPATCLRPAPAVGQDNALVYGEWLGYGSAGVEQLRANGII